MILMFVDKFVKCWFYKYFIEKEMLINKLKIYECFFQYVQYAPYSRTLSYFDDLIVSTYIFISK